MELLLWLGLLRGPGRISCTVKPRRAFYGGASSARAPQTGGPPRRRKRGILRSEHRRASEPCSATKTNRWDAAIVPVCRPPTPPNSEVSIAAVQRDIWSRAQKKNYIYKKMTSGEPPHASCHVCACTFSVCVSVRMKKADMLH